MTDNRPKIRIEITDPETGTFTAEFPRPVIFRQYDPLLDTMINHFEILIQNLGYSNDTVMDAFAERGAEIIRNEIEEEEGQENDEDTRV